MSDRDLEQAIADVPAGRWAVGVSGGADSVALLHLLRAYRPELGLHVVHLNHQARGADSDADASFVRELAEGFNLPVTVALREEVERTVKTLPRNVSARFRRIRIALFNRVVHSHGLAGVLLAHHADDVAETVLQRLLRGSGTAGLTGIARLSRASGGLLVCRPLIGVRRRRLREYLVADGQSWREDASNTSDVYLRNRLRKVLEASPALSEELIHLSIACRTLHDWTQASAPTLDQAAPVAVLRALPPILAHESARRWLVERGVPPGELTPDVIGRLLAMASDAAASPRQHFPGGVLVRRRQGRLFTDA